MFKFKAAGSQDWQHKTPARLTQPPETGPMLDEVRREVKRQSYLPDRYWVIDYKSEPGNSDGSVGLTI